MDTLDYDHNVFNQQNAEADKSLAVRFFVLPVRDEMESAKEGRPIFKDVVHVEVRVRGARNEVVHKPVDELVKRRFRDAWRAYEQGEELTGQGTPLSEWPSMSKSQVEELKYFGFFTVEHLAGARDDVLNKFPGLRTLRDRARNFMELAKGNAPLEKIQGELDSTKSDLAAAQEQLKDMSRRMAEMEAKKIKE